MEDFLIYATIPVTESDEDGEWTSRWLPVQCPRRDCGGEFMVRVTWTRLRKYTDHNDKTTVFTTKSCPYCFKVSKIPEKFWPEYVKEKYTKHKATNKEYFKVTLPRQKAQEAELKALAVKNRR